MGKPHRMRHHTTITRRLAGVVLALSLCFPLGCTDERTDNNCPDGALVCDNGTSDTTRDTTGNNTSNNMENNSTDTTPVDMGMDMSGEVDLSGCMDATCNFEFETFGDCTQVLNLGVLDASSAGTRTFYGNTRLLDSELAASCSRNGEQSLEFTFAYQVSSTAQLRLRIAAITNVDWVMTRATGTCDNEVRCRENDDSFFANAGVQYFVSAEPLSVGGEAELRLEIEVEPVNCGQTGSVCRDDVLVTCTRNEEVEFACGNSCTNMPGDDGSSVMVGRCDANDCATAEEVPNSGTTTYTGSWGGYLNTFRGPNVPIAGCDMAGSISPRGKDRYLVIKDLVAGQTVTIDASNDVHDDIIFPVRGYSGCDTTAAECVDAPTDLGDTLVFSVPEDGDFVFIIDGLSPQNDEPFEHTVTIE